jgi:hypothetical protein
MDIAIINKIDASKKFRIHFLFIDVPPVIGWLAGPAPLIRVVINDAPLIDRRLLSFALVEQAFALGES